MDTGEIASLLDFGDRVRVLRVKVNVVGGRADVVSFDEWIDILTADEVNETLAVQKRDLSAGI